MSLDRFLFAPVDPGTARVFRVGLALVLATVFWPEGRPVLGWIARRPDAAALWETVFLSTGWWVAALAALAAFAAGLRGRAAGWSAAILLLPLVFVRGAVSRQVLWFALVAFSLLRVGAGPCAGPIWPLRLVQLQLSTVYAVNAWAKLTPEYLGGEVLVGLSRHMPNFLVDLSDGRLHLGPAAVPAWLCALGTVAVESALAVGFWIPKLRVATAALGLLFHLSLQWVIQIGWLDWACVFLYLAFLLPFERTRDLPPGRP